jgi:hypothetical protein
MGLRRSQGLEERLADVPVDRRSVVLHSNHGVPVVDSEPDGDRPAGAPPRAERVEAVVEEVLDDRPDICGVCVGERCVVALEPDDEAVFLRERGDVVRKRPDDLVEIDPLQLRLAEPAHGAQDLELRQGAVGLRACAIDQILPRGLVLDGTKLVEEQAEGVQRVVELVKDCRDQDPHGLIPLDLEEPCPERLGAACGFFCARELGAQTEVVCKHPEESPDEDREGMVDDGVHAREGSGEGARLEARLGDHVEDDVRGAEQEANGDVGDEAKVAGSGRRGHSGGVYLVSRAGRPCCVILASVQVRSRYFVVPVFAPAFALALALACSGQKTTSSGTGEPDAAQTRYDAASVRYDATASRNTDVLTQHNDNARSGANTKESCLRPSMISTMHQVASFHVDGQIYAQPLVVTTEPHRLLIVASTANELFAFDLDTLSPTPVWQLGPETFGTPGQMPRWSNPLGILSTPVVDPVAGRVYVIARSCPSATSLTGCPQTLHSVDVATGQHLDAVTIAATYTFDDGTVTFNPDAQWNRPGLLLQNGQLVAGWACGQVSQNEPYIDFDGYVMAWSVGNLHAAPTVYVTAPHNRGAGIWQGGGGLTGDGESIYFNTGNGMLNPAASVPTDYPETPRDQENSVVRLQTSDGGTRVASYFDDRPYQADGNVFQYTNFYDYDMASSGVAWIPGTDDLVTGSKGGIVYLIDRTTMTERQTPLSPFTVAALPAGQTLHIASNDDGPEVYGAPAVWRRSSGGLDDALVYMWPRADRLTAFHYDHASSTMTVAAASSDVADGSGGIVSLSVNGSDTSTALVWATVASSGTQYIRAYDPTTLTQLWEGQVSSVPGYPGNSRYSCPTISAGRVYTISWSNGSGSDVLMFGSPVCGN